MVVRRRLDAKRKNIYVLKDKELRVEIIQLHHNILVVGHGER